MRSDDPVVLAPLVESDVLGLLLSFESESVVSVVIAFISGDFHLSAQSDIPADMVHLNY